jgi:hypothetical protein
MGFMRDVSTHIATKFRQGRENRARTNRILVEAPSSTFNPPSSKIPCLSVAENAKIAL